MNCIDCGEDLKESERRGARTCVACKGLMHFECAMSTPDESDACERCYCSDALSFRKRMTAAGVENG